MAGYRGFSMSNNAVDAYNSGEKPFSKWTKSEILKEIESLNVKTFELLKKMKVKTLKDNFLYKSSWHHSSKFYNEVDFYSVDTDKIESISEKELNELLNISAKKEKKKEVIGEITVQVWGGTRKHPKVIGYDTQKGIVKGDFLYFDGGRYKITAHKVVTFKIISD